MSALITVGNVLSSTGTIFTTDNTTYTFPAGVSKVRVFVWGGGGSGGSYGSSYGCGGSAAYVEGDINKGSMTTLTIYLNRAGGGHGPGGGSQTGGGYGAVYNSTNGYLMIAGAGGSAFGLGGIFGGAGGYQQGYAGGGTGKPGLQGIARNFSSGGGGSQTQGGQGGWGNSTGLQPGADGAYLTGGNAVLGSSYGNGGGGGYYGGGGGNGDGFETGYTGYGAGGGGSSYVNPGFVTNYKGADGQNGTTVSVLPGGSSSPFYVSGYGVGKYNGPGGGALVVIVPYLSGGGGGTSSTAPPLTIRLNNQVNANANQTFIGTSAVQTFTVPNGVFWIRFFLWGAGGTCQDGSKISRPDAAGSGSYVEGNLRTAPGTVYYIIVGRAGLTGLNNGGGGSGFVGTNGGGFTGIFSGSPAFGNAIAIAGGGGGSGTNNGNYFGGGGGYPSGGNGTGGATGGTQSAGGSGSSSGSQLQGANGGGGGGGGGYYGGGAGTGGNPSTGGGGGSSYYMASIINPITVNGINTATVGTNTLAANETSPYWVSPYGRSGYDGYAVIGFNTNTNVGPLRITLGSSSIRALGGVTTIYNSYKIHTFATPGTATFTVTPPNALTVKVLVVGGGGGGGATTNLYGGGGGAGGLVYSRTMSLTPGTYQVVVGAGGPAGTIGGDSTFNGLVAYGGGYGGASTTAGGNGGCGGGGGGVLSSVGGTGSQGFAGSQGNSQNVGGGGGGGMGTGGATGRPLAGAGTNGFRGGDGAQVQITGTPTYYAGGGGGGGGNGVSGGAVGGEGGGGTGGGTTTATAGTAGLGGGGGAGAAGGSGTVIMAYLLPGQIATVTTPTVAAGLIFWMDGADPAGTGVLPANGASITTWVDKSGNGKNATASAAATYSLSTKSLVFTGAQYYTTPFTTVPTTISVFLVINIGGGGYMDMMAGVLQVISTGYNQLVTIPGGSHVLNGATMASGTTLLYNFTFDSSASAAIYYNGALTGTRNGSTSYTGNGSIVIGSSDGVHETYTGTISEILIYNSVLSTTNRQKIEGYLAWKWGFASNLSASNPYKYDLPM